MYWNVYFILKISFFFLLFSCYLIDWFVLVITFSNKKYLLFPLFLHFFSLLSRKRCLSITKLLYLIGKRGGEKRKRRKRREKERKNCVAGPGCRELLVGRDLDMIGSGSRCCWEKEREKEKANGRKGRGVRRPYRTRGERQRTKTLLLIPNLGYQLSS